MSSNPTTRPADVVRYILEHKHWSQMQLAEELGVSHGSISAWAAKRQMVPHEGFVPTLAKLSDGQWTTDDLMKIWFDARRVRPFKGPLL